MEQLIVALTRYLIIATEKMEKDLGARMLPLGAAAAAPTPEPTPAPKKERKVKAPKAEVPAEEPVVEEKEKPLSEAESVTTLHQTAKAFVQRYQNETPGGITRAKKIMADEFKVDAISKLNHEQRLALIAILNDQMGADQKVEALL